MVCRTVMQYLVAGSGPPGHEIWPEMEMWVGDTPSAGDISWGHQQITKQDHFLLVSPCAHHTVARRRPAQPLPPGNMEYGPSAGVRLLPTHQHMYRRSFMTEQEHNFCLNCSQLSLSMISLRLCSTNEMAAAQIVLCHSWRPWRQTQVYSVLEKV